MARPTSIMQLVPVAVACGVASVLRTSVPVDPGLPATTCKGVEEHAVDVDQLDREPPAELLPGPLVELRVDQQGEERTLLDRPLEPLLELPGVGLLGRDSDRLAGVSAGG